MNVSKSRFISLESIPLNQLANSDIGQCGIYLMNSVAGFTPAEVRQRVASTAKASFAKSGKKSAISSLVVVRDIDGEPHAEKAMLITCVG